MKWTGFGYRNFQHLRARAFISFKLTKPTKRTVRELTFKEEKEKEQEKQKLKDAA